MIVTEQVAKEKLCPHAQRFGADIGPYCMASECMAWKWSAGFSPDELQSRKSYNPNPDVPKGYCGA